ncbi:MAG: ATP-binding protein [Treponema sp.]
MINRNSYIERLNSFKNKQIIKVITGIRRCGKSVLMTQFKENLLLSGVNKDQIISVNLEELENESLLNYQNLYSYIINHLQKDKMNYIFVDEVQLCVNFQKAIDSLFVKSNTDIYLTGSNANLLSGELATLLSGRYVTIEVQPFSFKEFLEYKSTDANLISNQNLNLQQLYLDYVRYGSFPFTLQLNNNEEDINQYLTGIYTTIIVKDIAVRHQIKDISILESVIRFMFDNTGNICSSKKISDTLTSGGRKVSQPTVENYMYYLQECYMIYEVKRFDIKGKEYLKTLSKYYIADSGLRNALLGYKNIDTGHILENLVYLELRRRSYKIYVGKVDSLEIDFVAVNQNETLYIQVSESLKEESTLNRELAPLKSIKDFNPRYIITMDLSPNSNIDGIKIINALDFLSGSSLT